MASAASRSAPARLRGFVFDGIAEAEALAAVMRNYSVMAGRGDELR